MIYNIGLLVFLQLFVYFWRKFANPYAPLGTDPEEKYIWYMGAAAFGCISCALRSEWVKRDFKDRENLFKWAIKKFKAQKKNNKDL